VSGRYLLDTNVVIALFNGETGIRARLAAIPEVFLSSVALGELHFGAAHSGRPEANEARIVEFAATCTVLGIDGETARLYGRIKEALRRKGRPIPENDAWIAACALQHGLTVATRDGHFSEVESIQLEIW
jgi:tRNA(fMet)-specific endonuclease VapC